jgi:hypothetical protein
MVIRMGFITAPEQAVEKLDAFQQPAMQLLENLAVLCTIATLR